MPKNDPQGSDGGVVRSDEAHHARAWLARLAPYRDQRPLRGAFEIVVTVAPFICLWLAMWLAVAHGQVWLCLLLSVPAAGFLVRLFMLQHDCGHGSLFRRRTANDLLGRLLSVLTLTPYDHWRAKHAIHHATGGNLDRRGTGDIETLTVREYLALGWLRRLGYRLLRSPAVLIGVAPVYLFLIRYRLPADLPGTWSAWVSTISTNLAITLVVGALIAALGFWEFLIIQGPISLLASSAGVYLFYVQHQFEHTSWEHDREWTFHEGALHGSSYLDLPSVLRWFTANIGMHHVHHLSSRIPSYRLPEVLRDFPELCSINRLTLWQSLTMLRLSLWDEERKVLIGFRDLRHAPAAAA